MCLIVFAYRVGPFSLAVAANRDEFYGRESSQASFWHPRPGFYHHDEKQVDQNEDARQPILAGRDLEAGGTWMGVDKHGRFAAVTNYREPEQNIGPNRRSRGELVSEFLVSDSIAATDYLKAIRKTALLYEGFNLLVGDKSGLWYYSNRDERNEARKLDPGRIYCLCNRLLDDPWPKVVRAKHEMSKLMNDIQKFSMEEVKEKLFHLLQDTTQAPDDQLPRDTGRPEYYEKHFSSIFVESFPFLSHWYGTRASTVILVPATVDTDGTGVFGSFSERSFGMNGTNLGEVNDKFPVDSFPS